MLCKQGAEKKHDISTFPLAHEVGLVVPYAGHNIASSSSSASSPPSLLHPPVSVVLVFKTGI
jgi:hypothetical protein